MIFVLVLGHFNLVSSVEVACSLVDLGWLSVCVITHIFRLGDKLLQDGDFSGGVDRIWDSWNHLIREHLDDFGVVHLLVVVWINLGQQVVDFLFSFDDVHHSDHVLELNLIDYTILIIVE